MATHVAATIESVPGPPGTGGTGTPTAEKHAGMPFLNGQIGNPQMTGVA
jgi:hypothetical protein